MDPREADVIFSSIYRPRQARNGVYRTVDRSCVR